MGDWAKKTWTPAQVRGAKVTAKAADKAHTAEIVSDYVAEKAAKMETIRKGAAMRIWAKEKQHKAKHKHHHSASAGLKAAVKKEAKKAIGLSIRRKARLSTPRRRRRRMCRKLRRPSRQLSTKKCDAHSS